MHKAAPKRSARGGMAMESKFKGWICDVCHEPILTAEQGYVEWSTAREITSGESGGGDLRLVHRKDFSPLTGSKYGCQFDDRALYEAGYSVRSLPLDRFRGPDGLMMLLRLLYENEVPQNQVLEMTKRLHIPGYEHARLYFEEAISAGAFEPNTPPGYHHQYQIDDTLRYAENDRT
jgi:hypothetical protein